jgi:rSAM/selenodomain-associated transferase 1
VSRKCNRHLIVFTRFPEAGTTKTRLIPALGAKGAADLQRKMTEHTLARVSHARITPVLSIEIRYEGGDAEQMQNWLGSEYAYHPQGDGDLGRRMSSAFKDAFQNGADQVALIGTDIPGIAALTLYNAFDILEHEDLALGPTRDGGYYLIGLHCKAFEAARMLFAGINWGSRSVLADTLKIAAVSGLRTRLLDELADVDYPEDLLIWEREVRRRADD